jgi:hypothetical protein
LEFGKAKSYFERARAIEPGNEEISRLIFEIDKASLLFEQRQVEMKKRNSSGSAHIGYGEGRAYRATVFGGGNTAGNRGFA